MIVHDIYIRNKYYNRCGLYKPVRVDPLTKSCPTVRTSSLPQSKTKQNSNWKEYDGTQDTKTGEGVLQYTNSAGRATSNHDNGGGGSWLLNDGVHVGIVMLWRWCSISCRGGSSSGGAGVGVGRRRLEARLRRGDGPVVALSVVAPLRGRGVGGGPLLQQRLVVHAGTRRGAPGGGSSAETPRGEEAAPNFP